MNANEVIANRAIELLGGEKGDYSLVHPNDHVHCGQSTNDIYSTCVKMTLFRTSEGLLDGLVVLIGALSERAKAFDGVVKMGRTQLQDAVPIRLGQEFAAYASVMRRERERLARGRQESWTSTWAGQLSARVSSPTHPISDGWFHCWLS